MKGIKDKIRQRWYLRWILLFSNWAAQGMINADKTEKIYKISFTLIFWGLIYFWFNIYKLSFLLQLLSSFLLAHTLNYFVNGSLATILMHRLFIGTLTKKQAFNYLNNLETRLQSIKSIESCAVFGSISRGQLKDSSDIDITFVRKLGFLNAIKSIYFVVQEKFRTNTNLIPIEPFLADSIPYMKKRYQSNEVPIVIKGKQALLKFYDETMSIKQAEEKNNYKSNV